MKTMEYYGILNCKHINQPTNEVLFCVLFCSDLQEKRKGMVNTNVSGSPFLNTGKGWK